MSIWKTSTGRCRRDLGTFAANQLRRLLKIARARQEEKGEVGAELWSHIDEAVEEYVQALRVEKR